MKTLRSGLAAMLLALVCSVGLVVQSARPAEALTPGDIGNLAKDGLEKGSRIVGSASEVMRPSFHRGDGRLSPQSSRSGGVRCRQARSS